jgi:hypothetical protein
LGADAARLAGAHSDVAEPLSDPSGVF